MRTRLFSAVLATVLICLNHPIAQTGSPSAEVKTDYSQESAVIEQMDTKIGFDREGKRNREQVTRVRINTDAGMEQWGILSLPYQSAIETVEVAYVRVRKPDNTIVVTAEDNAQDLDAEITRSAPFYSDLREKHIAVKGLAKGDVLEYQTFWHPIKALIPGQFWFEYNFHKQGIVLDERLEISAPVDRAVKFKGPTATQRVEKANGWNTYSWTYTKLKNEKETGSERQKIDAARGRLPAPDVQFSSFQSWEEVGAWYWKLQSERAEPSAAVKAKAAELTSGLQTDAAKIQALYNFVSTKYRYIGIAFGIGRYQPHSADDVLSNNYGDCKDKHTLLAALLQASGVKLNPALISAAHQLDPDVPSPGQFDHIIGYLPQEKGPLWLDTTPEVAPAGFLVSPLRDKPALVIESETSAKLINTPFDPPSGNGQTFKIEGKLKEDGSFEAHVDDTAHGDWEVMLRAAFRRISEPQWKEAVQEISRSFGYAGTVSDVSVSAADATNEPFHFSYSYNRKDYPDWSNHQFTVPGHPFYLPAVADDAKEATWLGSRGEVISESKVEIPKGYKAEIPANVDLIYNFAEYHAHYSLEGGAIRATRRMISKVPEVPVGELDDYRSFLKKVRNDIDQYVQTSSASAASSGQSSRDAFRGAYAQVRSLPDSGEKEANIAEEEGRSAVSQRDTSKAIEALQRAVDADPKFTRAWIELAAVELVAQQKDAALDSLVKAINVDRSVVIPRKIYAQLLDSLKRNDAALEAWKGVLQIAPEDLQANSSIGWNLVQQKRYGEALPFLETAAKNDATGVEQLRLGTAYLKAGKPDQGKAALLKLVDSDPSAMNLNDVGYER